MGIKQIGLESVDYIHLIQDKEYFQEFWMHY
jgi:hypothetical protein